MEDKKLNSDTEKKDCGNYKEENNRDIDIDEIIKKVAQNAFYDEAEGIEIGDCFNENILSSVCYGIKDGKKVAYFPCDTCKTKKAIIEEYNRVCIKEYIPPYIDKDCRDYKIALVIEKIDDCIIEKAFTYLVYRTSIDEILRCIDDPEWRKQAEALLRSTGFKCFIDENFGRFTKQRIIDMLFDVNFCYFDGYYKRNLCESECVLMVKYYIVQVLRNRIKESLYKIAKLIELELEYKIAVIESEIRYLIKCILQEILITPIPAANYNIESFNKIGSLTDILKILDGISGKEGCCGKHDQRNDFRHIRDTIRKYEKVIRTTLDILNKKILEYEKLIDQRAFIVGITGICDRNGLMTNGRFEKSPIITPPVPIVVVNPSKK